MKKRYLFFLYIIFYYNNLFSQFNDNHWLLGFEYTDPPVVGNNFGLTNINFKNGNINIEGPIDEGTDHYLNNSSISDYEGNLIAYTNGLYIKNNNYQVMLNGDTLNRTIVETNQELRYKSTDVAIQGCLFLPYPGHPDSVLLFYTGDSYNGMVGTFNQDLSMAIINTQAEGGAGEVVQKEIPVIVDDTLSYGNLTAVKHANGRDWWLIVSNFEGAYYYPILIDIYGVHVGEKVFYDIDLAYPGGGAGQVRFSPDGKYYATYGGRSTQSGTWLHLFDFDRCTGFIGNRRSVFHHPIPFTVLYGGISFSPNSRFLYHSIIDTIFQYDLYENDLLSSREVVLVREEVPSGAILRFFQSQLAPDGKIYFCSTNTMRNLNVIHYPDNKGLDCQAQERGIQLRTVNSQTVPNHPNYRLGPLDGSPCDTLGIDNLPRAWWRYEQDTLNLSHITFHDLSFYEPTTWDWTFGDGNVSSEPHPEFTYQNPGVYEVCLTVSNFNGSHTHCKTIYGVTGSHNPVLQATLQVGPNPFAQRLTLTLSTPLTSPRVQVLDLMGRTLMDAPIELGINEFDTTHLPAGAYFWQVSTRTEGVVKSGKLVKM
jgi:hypothetical protein